jgi:hypothetical protein
MSFRTASLAPFSCQNPRRPLARMMKRMMKASGLSPVRKARPAAKMRMRTSGLLNWARRRARTSVLFPGLRRLAP